VSNPLTHCSWLFCLHFLFSAPNKIISQFTHALSSLGSPLSCDPAPTWAVTLHPPGCRPCPGALQTAEGAQSPFNAALHATAAEDSCIHLRYPSDSFNCFLPVVNWCQSVQLTNQVHYSESSFIKRIHSRTVIKCCWNHLFQPVFRAVSGCRHTEVSLCTWKLFALNWGENTAKMLCLSTYFCYL